jgi:predicted flap endonuclease-1-like 5' DNA nuclease
LSHLRRQAQEEAPDRSRASGKAAGQQRKRRNDEKKRIAGIGPMSSNFKRKN